MRERPDAPDARLRAIETIYRDRYPAFLRVARAFLGEREPAHDAVQETFAKAIRSRNDVRPDRLEPWLWATLTNQCRDMLRRQSHTTGAAASEQASNGRPDDWAEVRAAVATLPERQRHVLFLRHYADLDYESIANVLGIERGTVAATLHAAHAAVRRTIEEAVR
jgi:RNA polymerase sigma-70 factor (ECF subfamily)